MAQAQTTKALTVKALDAARSQSIDLIGRACPACWRVLEKEIASTASDSSDEQAGLLTERLSDASFHLRREAEETREEAECRADFDHADDCENAADSLDAIGATLQALDAVAQQQSTFVMAEAA